LKEKVPKSSSKDEDTTQPCTHPDWTIVLLSLEHLFPDAGSNIL